MTAISPILTERVLFLTLVAGSHLLFHNSKMAIKWQHKNMMCVGSLQLGYNGSNRYSRSDVMSMRIIILMGVCHSKCSTSCTSCFGGWSTFIQQMFFTGTWSPATCLSMPTVTWKLQILGLLALPLTQTSWQNMSWHDGTELLSCFWIAQSTPKPLMSGQWAAYSWSCLIESLSFLAKTMSSSLFSLQRY